MGAGDDRPRPAARAWPGLPAERRRRLTTLLGGFRVAEDAVAQHLTPFADVAEHVDTMMVWIFFLQRRDEDRHALFFDRVAAEVLQLPGATPAERRAAARELVPTALLELFEVRLPVLAAELAAGRTGILDGVRLYHMVLEGAVFSAGQQALLDDLADGALPGVRNGVQHVELDERWQVGFGVRCLTEAGDPEILFEAGCAPPRPRRRAARVPSPTTSRIAPTTPGTPQIWRYCCFRGCWLKVCRWVARLSSALRMPPSALWAADVGG